MTITLSKKSFYQIDNGRLANVMNTVTLHEDANGLYATVPSTNENSIAIYRVGIDAETMLATSCNCTGNAEYGRDCKHLLAVDRVCEDARALLFMAKRNAAFQAVAIVEPVVTIGAAMTDANEQLTRGIEQDELAAQQARKDMMVEHLASLDYEALASTKRVLVPACEIPLEWSICQGCFRPFMPKNGSMFCGGCLA